MPGTQCTRSRAAFCRGITAQTRFLRQKHSTERSWEREKGSIWLASPLPPRRQTMPKTQERDVWAEFRACGPAQQQAIQVHMDQNFNPNCQVDEAYFNKLLKEALDAEMPYFARKGRVKRQ